MDGYRKSKVIVFMSNEQSEKNHFIKLSADGFEGSPISHKMETVINPNKILPTNISPLFHRFCESLTP